MFIELTDQLRCPADHEERFLVLIPYEVIERQVRRGVLGCPVCRREYPIVGGLAEFGAGQPPAAGPPVSSTGLEASGLLALLGLEGPGGYVGLFGQAARLATALVPLLPGVHFGVVNPPPGVEASAAVSLLRAPRSPFKSRSLRGVVLGADVGSDPGWQREAARSVLPGLRVVGQGGTPPGPGMELLAQAGGWWVAKTG